MWTVIIKKGSYKNFNFIDYYYFKGRVSNNHDVCWFISIINKRYYG